MVMLQTIIWLAILLIWSVPEVIYSIFTGKTSKIGRFILDQLDL